MRSRICELKSVGYGAKRISKVHPEIPLSTIKYTLRKEAERKNNVTLPRPGAPRKLTQQQRDGLIQLTVTNPDSTYPDLLASIDNRIKERALRGILRDANRRKWKKLRRPQLLERHAAARLAWARQYRGINWRRVK